MTLTRIAQKIRLKIRDDDDICICISGREGVGKSTLGILLGYEVDAKNFDLEKNVLYSPKKEEIKEKLVSTPRYSAIVADEAIKILFKQRWATQSFLVTLFNVSRQENKCVILILPRFTDLNEYFRNHRVYLHFFVYARGKAAVFGINNIMGCTDPWKLKENFAIISKKLNNRLPDFVETREYENALKACNNFICFVEFPMMPKKMSDMYKELKDKFKYDDLEASYDKDGKGFEGRARDKYSSLSYYGIKDIKEALIPLGKASMKLMEQPGWNAKRVSDEIVCPTSIIYKAINAYKGSPEFNKKIAEAKAVRSAKSGPIKNNHGEKVFVHRETKIDYLSEEFDKIHSHFDDLADKYGANKNEKNFDEE